MVRCDLRIVAAALVGLAVMPVAPSAGHAQPAPELSRAKDLYGAAEAAMKDSRFDDAIRDYGLAYELSRDPALFFKLGRAYERAGTCEIALTYYARYLREGTPAEPFATTTRQRITACGGDPRSLEAGASPVAPPPMAPPEPPAKPAVADPGASPRRSAPAPSAPAADPTPGSADVTARSSAAMATPSNRHKVGWVLIGGGVALATLGGVLAYAADSSENDVRDLYVGFDGKPPTFDAQTKQRYDDLVAEGRRYQHLSWASFGLAGAAAVGAAVLFLVGGRETAPHARITPVITRGTAGIAVTF